MNEFNFRHVAKVCGVEPSNENHWAIGKILRGVAAKKGIEPSRLLAEKTNPEPTVAAPHCIAHYPVELFEDCVEAVRLHFEGRTLQNDLFGENY